MDRKTARCLQTLIDFANLFKAFIGVNYLSMAFAISQSGIALGIIGLLMISTATVHCCHLIIKCKREVIRRIIEGNFCNGDQPTYPLTQTIKMLNTVLEKRLSYGDIAYMSLGKFGTILVNFSLVVTQFGFCVNYFIFLGNTIQKMFPYYLPYIDVIEINNSTNPPDIVLVPKVLDSADGNFDDIHNIQPTTNSSTPENILPISYVSQSPSYNILVVLPLPIFILFGYLRSIRHLGPVSVIANLSSFIGYVIMMWYILKDFSVSETITWFRFSTFPIFFGQVTAAYEGIGTIVPIESSMEGNHNLFPLILYLVMILFTCILASLGFLGYLYLGTSTAQVLIWNLQSGSILELVVGTVVCIGVFFTFPLQCFPVIEIFEQLIFAPGKCCGPRYNSVTDDNTVNTNDVVLSGSLDEGELQCLLQDSQVAECLRQLPVANEIPKSVSTWKRNILRTVIVVAQLGTAYAFRNEFAYISSFTGAIGSTLIAFIIPSLIHLKLKRHESGMLIILKDVILIIFGLVGGISGVYASVQSIIKDLE